MKKILFISLLILLSSCGKGYRVVRITHSDTIKTVEVCWGDTAIADTTFTVPATIPDTLILKQLRVIEDSLKYEKFKADSLYLIFQRDSLYKVFQQDSINFRTITRIINGGFNSWEERYRLWLNAREVIKNHEDAVIQK